MTVLEDQGPKIAAQLRNQIASLQALVDRLDPPAVATAVPAQPGVAVPVPTRGAVMATAERLRQIEHEGHTPDTDAVHTGAEIAWAAYSYLSRAAADGEQDSPAIPAMWPFPNAEWKPKESRVRNLVVAAALVIAEIDRRLAAGEKP